VRPKAESKIHVFLNSKTQETEPVAQRDTMALIEITNLTKNYVSGEETVEALRGIDLSIEAGEFVTIMGQSGSGKSTLLSVLGGMNHPTSGEVEMADVPLYSLPGEKLADFRAQNLGFVFQSFHLIPYLTALENVMLPLAIAELSNREKRAKAKEALGQVGLAAKVDRLPNQLSGGEQERVAIARAIVNNPQILLADEPTGNLDSRTSEEVMGLFRELNKSGQTVVMVTHNPGNCAYTDRTIFLKDGRVVAEGDGPTVM
jgi:putative ABC transport system ATP-binding protein